MIKQNRTNTLQAFFCILIGLLLTSNVFADGYQIKLKSKSVKDTTMLLAYHLGHKIFILDTTDINSKGMAVFEGDEALMPGIYLGVYPGSKYFEFLVPREAKKQKFSIETDTSNFVRSMKISGSEENEIFNAYQQFLADQHIKIKKLKSELKEIPEEDKDAQKIKRNELSEIETKIQTYREQLMTEQADSYTAFLFRSMKEPTAPEAPKNEDGETDPYFGFYYIKKNFWKDFNFSDNRILRTPIFHNKIEKFLETYTPKHPDSINVAADIIIENSKANDDLFKYALGYITQKYQKSKIMGMEAVFVHLAKNYYLKGQADWVNEKQLEKINERYQKLRHNLIGLKAKDIKMQNLEGEMTSLYDMDASYTLVLFWDYKCGNCKKRMPKIADLYHKYKDKGFEVMAVCTRSEIDKWKEYIDGKDLPFTHVIDPKNTTHFRLFYDIYSTPTVYLLDKDKKIVAKRLSEEQFDGMLEGFYAKEEAGKEEEKDEGK